MRDSGMWSPLGITTLPSLAAAVFESTQGFTPITCTAREIPSTVPGAFAVAGPDALQYDNADEYTTMAQEASTSGNVETAYPVEPVAATVVGSNDDVVEEMQEQIRDYEQQLEQVCKAPLAEVVTDSQNPSAAIISGRRKKCIIGVAVTASIMVGIVVGVTLSSSKTTPQPTPEQPTPQPAPEQPTPQPAPELINLLSSVSLDGGTALQTNSTPQNQALNWLAGNANLDQYSNKTKIQRYVLATFYYSTNGVSWKNNTGWLGDGNECEWWNSAYEEFCIDGTVKEFTLEYNNIVGVIPAELALLSTSVVILSDNDLMGIPSEIGFMTNLGDLYLGDDNLMGSIPSEIGLLTNMYSLWLGSNDLKGSIPSEIGLLTELEWLYLYENTLIGTVPSEIGLLTKLRRLSLYNNNLTGNFTCPDFVNRCLISCDDLQNDSCQSL